MATIVSLHAHPDDEALLTAGWLATRAAAGDRVVLLFATDGAAGLTSGERSDLGVVRRREAAASAEAIGADRVVWLGYDDSGMEGDPSGADHRFAAADVDEAAARVATVLDEEGADVLTGYDANGGYGHPDHVQVHRVARRARELAARRPRLLEATMDRTWLVRLLRVARPVGAPLPGLTIPGDDVFSAREQITLRADVSGQVEAKRAALAAHASQRGGGIRTVSLLLALPRPLARRVLGTEWFIEPR